MKTHTLSIAVLLALSTLCPAQTQAGKISFMMGEVEIQRNGEGDWAKARMNLPINASDAIKTGKASRCEVALVEDRVIRIDENTTAHIVSPNPSAVSVKATKGAVWSNVKKLVDRKSTFEVSSSVATAAIRGTVVNLSCDTVKTGCQVLAGEVEVVTRSKSRSGKPVTAKVKAGEEFILTENFDDYMRDAEAALRNYMEEQEKEFEKFQQEQEQAMDEYQKSQEAQMNEMLEAERKAFIPLEGKHACCKRKIDDKKLAANGWAQWNQARDKALGWQ